MSFQHAFDFSVLSNQRRCSFGVSYIRLLYVYSYVPCFTYLASLPTEENQHAFLYHMARTHTFCHDTIRFPSCFGFEVLERHWKALTDILEWTHVGRRLFFRLFYNLVKFSYQSNIGNLLNILHIEMRPGQDFEDVRDPHGQTRQKICVSNILKAVWPGWCR